ncbi:MAG TPA: transcriptional regulator [Devosia sp.]|nr:transcriptional regulator [Devosia sp.]
MSKAFDMIMGGLDDVENYLGGDREGFATHIPEDVDVKAIRTRLKLSQVRFAETFGFSVGRVRDWEQKRFAIDAPLRVYLTVIEKEPDAVLRALSGRGRAEKRRGQTGVKAAPRAARSPSG